jgi:alkylation response protein AidB-like acyl-CoA dehydrogenase
VTVQLQTRPDSKSIAVTPAVLKTKEEAIERARALWPRIRARAKQVDSDRYVPEETIRELNEAGLFGVVMPRARMRGLSALARSMASSLVLRTAGATAIDFESGRV